MLAGYRVAAVRNATKNFCRSARDRSRRPPRGDARGCHQPYERERMDARAVRAIGTALHDTKVIYDSTVIFAVPALT
jgi:hypothetical protein